jgi:hypothetical protein
MESELTLGNEFPLILEYKTNKSLCNKIVETLKYSNKINIVFDNQTAGLFLLFDDQTYLNYFRLHGDLVNFDGDNKLEVGLLLDKNLDFSKWYEKKTKMHILSKIYFDNQKGMLLMDFNHRMINKYAFTQCIAKATATGYFKFPPMSFTSTSSIDMKIDTDAINFIQCNFGHMDIITDCKNTMTYIKFGSPKNLYDDNLLVKIDGDIVSQGNPDKSYITRIQTELLLTMTKYGKLKLYLKNNSQITAVMDFVNVFDNYTGYMVGSNSVNFDKNQINEYINESKAISLNDFHKLANYFVANNLHSKIEKQNYAANYPIKTLVECYNLDNNFTITSKIIPANNGNINYKNNSPFYKFYKKNKSNKSNVNNNSLDNTSDSISDDEIDEILKDGKKLFLKL